MKKLTRFSVEYPVTVMMLILAVFLLGYISFSKLSIDLFPDLNNPRLYVEIKAGERPPEEIEKQFVKSIESLAILQKQVVQVSSISRVGSAQVTVEYSWEADMDEAFLDLQKALTAFSQNSELDELNITQLDPNAEPIMTLALSNPQITDMDELRRVAENYLRNELVRLEGIADVELLGQEQREVVIETDAYLMKAYGLTPSEIANKIAGYNRNISGGSLVEMGKKYVIKGVSEFQSLEDIGNVILTYQQPVDLSGTPIPGQWTPVFLRDVAKIRFQNKDPENIVHVNQQRCLALAVYKETRYNTVKAVKVLLDDLSPLRQALPGYDLRVIQNQGQFVTTAINEVKQTALFGILLAVIVLYVFLRRLGATAIISMAIPISIVATFNLMFFNGLTLNIMTLGGLALGAGMLVDNAIVVMENITRNMEAGLSLRDAAVDGTAQVAGAITSSTLTTVVVFLPIVYLHGVAGELFKDQAWTVTFSLLSSLVVAILIIPMLSSKVLNTKQKIVKDKSLHFTFYRSFLRKILEHPWRFIGLGAVLVIIAIVMVPFIGSEFIPKTESNELNIDVKLAEGADLNRTDATVKSIETMINDLVGENIETMYTLIGPSMRTSSDETFRDENTATITLLLKKEHPLKMQEVMARISQAFSAIPDVEFQYSEQQGALQMVLGTSEAPIVVQIRGEDLGVLRDLSDQVRQKLANVDGLFNIATSFDEDREEVNIKLDRVRAGLLNVDITAVATELENELSGRKAAEWEDEGEIEDITLKLPHVSLSQLADIEIAVGQQKIRIDDIADIQVVRVPKEIRRQNQTRVGLVSAQLSTGKPLDKVIKDIQQNLAQITFPTDYRYEITGEEQKRQESFANLKFALLLAVILVYMVMASQFESLVHPFTILLTIPLALTGTVFIFFILGKSFNIMALIGVIMLGGIAVNNSIILVDAVNQLKREGLPLIEAIVEAGQRRIRPILMTSATTILALLPLTFGIGEGAALRQPMALAVIGGLLTSTLLTLIIIPCVYLKLDRFSK
jgi:hydrophobic/amphiphilic exporter-1 (mainly G- bacteria), HAE1 family